MKWHSIATATTLKKSDLEDLLGDSDDYTVEEDCDEK